MIGQIKKPNYTGGNTDDEILNAIFEKLFICNRTSVTTISTLNHEIGLKLDNEKEDYFEALLISTPFIEGFKNYNSTYYNIKLSPTGIIELNKHGNYKKYLLSKLTIEEICKLVLNELNGNWIKNIPEILNDIGIDINKSRGIEYYLKSKGYIECGKSGCFIKPAGEAFLYDFFDNPNNAETSTNSEFSSQSEIQQMSTKIDELITHLNKAGVEREILFNELQDLKSLYSKLNKKNWNEIVIGKLVDLGLSKLIEKETIDYIFKSLIGMDFPKFLNP